MSKTAIIHFKNEVTPLSMDKLLKAFSHAILNEVEDIHICINSGGGNTQASIDMYNLINIHNDSFNITTYNSAQCASAAFLLFLAGKNRKALRNSQFMFHEAKSTFNSSLTERQLRAELKNIELLNLSNINIIKDYLNKEDDEVKRMFYEGTFLGADEAVELGIAHEKVDSIPTYCDYKYIIHGNKNDNLTQIEIIK